MVARQEAGGISGWAKKNEEIKKYKLVVTEQSQGWKVQHREYGGGEQGEQWGKIRTTVIEQQSKNTK